MSMKASFIALVTIFIASGGLASTNLCAHKAPISCTFIGANKDVLVETSSRSSNNERRSLQARQDSNGTQPVSVCGTQCDTHCYNPDGGGPDPKDCHVIADALRFESENSGPTFDIPFGENSTITLSYQNCSSLFVNQEDSGVDLTYCKVEWANTIDDLAQNCPSTEIDHGGICLGPQQDWFIQVQHGPELRTPTN
ncbi:hypothetical protein BDN72DRAFT_958478 [Pluteus cervinus]|uniref:Uncharacterized protein n=1 Tax=Pluteus cervinus TaxID=181527 RepID=A0ACD3AYU4_9AGAR|nr:hypothetical protein BDN72DRAFT_958478 [Pluteus cervinus]